MFLRLFNFLRGYLLITVSGFSVERFLNLASNRGIYVWQARWRDGKAYMFVSIKGFKLLKPCWKKTNCKVRIEKKVGLPFILFRYRKRKILVFGLVTFIGSIYFMSSFVWLINVEGNSRITSEAIIEKLSENGIRAGVFKSVINLRKAENALMNEFSDISWVNLSVKGTQAKVVIVETIPKTEVIDKNTPCNVVAKKNGVIVNIATGAGRPLVKPGDVVNKGDILVSSELIVGTEETGYFSHFVHAYSEITAKMYYEFSFNIPLSYTVKSFTGNVKRNYGIILFDRILYLKNSKSPFVNYDKITEENRIKFGDDYPLPAITFTEIYREFLPVTVMRSIEEAEIMGHELVEARLEREFPEDTVYEEKNISFEVFEEYVTVHVKITTIERIDEPQLLPPDTPLD